MSRDSARHGTTLLPVFGILFAMAVTIGGTIGVGILRQPGPVAKYLSEPWIIMLFWVGGGVYSALGAINVSELATLIPRAGGFYVYAREALGERIGFAVGWSDYLGNVAATAYAASAAVEFLTRLVPIGMMASRLLACCLILFFAGLQWFGVRVSARVQQIASAAGAIGLLGLVAACFLHSPRSTPLAHASAAVPWAAMVLAVQSIVVTYDGWYGSIYFAEETRQAVRQIPRAMFGGLATITGMYLLMNAAFLRALGPDGLAASDFAAADAARVIFGARGQAIVSILGIVILLTLLHVVLMSGARIIYAVSRDGLFWRGGSFVAVNGTPRHALALSVAISITLVLSGTVDEMIAFAGFFFVVNYLSAYVSLIVLRRTRPDAVRPFRAPAFPLTPVLSIVTSLAFLIGAVIGDRVNSLWALGLLSVSFPIRSILRARLP